MMELPFLGWTARRHDAVPTQQYRRARVVTAHDRAPAITRGLGGQRVSARGKHLWCGGAPVRVHGVTYGSFAKRSDGASFPDAATIRRDFTSMRHLGVDTLRTYEVPSPDLLEIAGELGLRILAGVHHHDWRTESGTGRAARRRITDAANRAVDEALEILAGRSEILAVAVGNEVPVDLVRLHGRSHVERTLTGMIDRLHEGDPRLLTTYVNFPTTEFVEIPNADLVAFNVFLEDPEVFRRYVDHLQLISRDRPLLVTEMGIASEVHGETVQFDLLAGELGALDGLGTAGGFVFSWTDDWVVSGEPVPGWGFGITTEDRVPKPAARAVAEWCNLSYPKGLRETWPRLSVVVCAYNEEATIGACLDSVLASSYPDLELIFCEDGSTDATAAIAASRGVRMISLDHGGLSRARNAGLDASTGDIVAYLDADATCHPDWPYHLALSFESGVVATGGPNLPVPDVGLVERAIAHVPGQASEVLLSSNRAEHVPGCNMAFDRHRLIEIGGFDVRYVAAGDDVDVCWKLLDLDHEIGFSPSAQVDHHRRSTMKGFLRQQRGYGRAERMLSGPHRHRLNALGQVRWRGFVYGRGALLPGLLRSTVYTGWSGSAPFQPAISHRAENAGGLVTAALPLAVVIGILSALAGIVTPAALFVTAGVVITILTVGVLAALSAELPHSEPHPWRVRCIVGLLTLAQPLARTWGRMTGSALDADPIREVHWTGDRLRWLDDLAFFLQSEGRLVRHGGIGDFWDLEVFDRGPVAVRVTTAVAWAWEPRVVVRRRIRLSWTVGLVLLAALAFAVDMRWGVVAVAVAVGSLVVSFLRTASSLRAALAVTTAQTRPAPEPGTAPE